MWKYSVLIAVFICSACSTYTYSKEVEGISKSIDKLETFYQTSQNEIVLSNIERPGWPDMLATEFVQLNVEDCLPESRSCIVTLKRPVYSCQNEVCEMSYEQTEDLFFEPSQKTSTDEDEIVFAALKSYGKALNAIIVAKDREDFLSVKSSIKTTCEAASKIGVSSKCELAENAGGLFLGLIADALDRQRLTALKEAVNAIDLLLADAQDEISTALLRLHNTRLENLKALYVTDASLLNNVIERDPGAIDAELYKSAINDLRTRGQSIELLSKVDPAKSVDKLIAAHTKLRESLERSDAPTIENLESLLARINELQSEVDKLTDEKEGAD